MSSLEANYFDLEIFSLRDPHILRKVSSVNFMDSANAFTIEANHAPLIGWIQPDCKIILQCQDGEEDYKLNNGGLVFAKDNRLMVFDNNF